MSPPQQSIPISVLIAVSSGFLTVLASLCVAYPTHVSRRTPDIEFSSSFLRIGFVSNILFNLASSAAYIISTFYGPIGLVEPTVRSSMLLSNMLLYGPSGLNIEPFSTEMRIATFQIVLATILLPTVGPGSQDDQDLEEILTRPLSALWLISLTVSMVVCSSRLHSLSNESFIEWSENDRLALLLGAHAPGASVGASCSRALTLTKGAIPLAIATIGVAVSFYIEMHVFYRAASAVRQTRFVPLLSSCCIVTAAISGIVIWEDYKVISSWSGYVSVMVLIVLANYQLLCSDGSKSNVYIQEPTKLLPETVEVIGATNTTPQDRGIRTAKEFLPLLSVGDEFACYSNVEAGLSSDSETASDTESESSVSVRRIQDDCILVQ